LSGCLYCIDNDIIKKLATFDLFNETVQCFGIEPQQIRILGTAKYKFNQDWAKFKSGKSRKAQDNVTNYEKILELAESLPTILDSEIDSEVFAALSQDKDIQAGEAILASHIVRVLQQPSPNEAFVLTGDKVFLRTLAMLDIPDIQVSLINRIWCLEQLVLQNVKVYGFEVVCRKIVPVRECDMAIKAVFGSGTQAVPDNALVTLQSQGNRI